jgi:hypothetical protein
VNDEEREKFRSTVKSYTQWEKEYPTLQLVVHNQSAEVKDYFGAWLSKMWMQPSGEPEPDTNELWFDTFWIPVGDMTINQLLDSYADERSVECCEGTACVRYWYD